MQAKLQELTEKIYNEGVLKAQEEIQLLIADANKKAELIENEAEKKAKSIIQEAEKKAAELTKHVQSELKMSINQSTAALKQELASIITAKAIQAPVKELFEDKKFLEELIKTIIASWSSKGLTELSVILPEKNKKSLDDAFQKQLSKELDKGIEISFSDNVKSGFKVIQKNGGYQLSFTDQDFINYFKQYLRPKTNELLFEKE